ncbi:MAG: hypothetical protein LDL51_04120 [Chloroflexi bacterium]|nr:hypothetical protein [Chloroflexota bacterium]
MNENPSPRPEDILNNLLNGLQSPETERRLDAVRQLSALNYSSEAVRNELEKLAAADSDESIRKEALAALGAPAQRNVRRHFNKADKASRQAVLREISEWEKLGLIDSFKADLLRRRYDFDLTPASQVESAQSKSGERLSPQPAEPVPAAPRPTLTQTLLSESNIKIALYLGAFFVVASAAILGAFVDIFRIPLLILGTVIFGGLSIAIRKRLPQPSFALFIVFSFFLPITANVVENTLGLKGPLNAAYWIVVGLLMTLIWGGGTWLYSSRLFSLTAFAAFGTALYRFGDVFNAEAEFSAAMLGLAALAGLAGVWGLKKWRGAKFALPLFLVAQLLQFGTLAAFQGRFMFGWENFYVSELWKLLLAFMWALAFLFYVLSNLLYPVFVFPWLAAGTLVFIPWLVGAAFEADSLTNAILFAVWGAGLSAAGELFKRIEAARTYSLPVLLASIPALTAALFSGFAKSDTLGIVLALLIALNYGILHWLRPHGWQWVLSLISFSIAYFAFLDLPFLERADFPAAYRMASLALIFLTLELFLKKASRAWNLPPLFLGGIFTFLASAALFDEKRAFIGFSVFTLFFLIYAVVHRKSFYGYLPAGFFALTLVFALSYYELDLWLPVLTALSAAYFAAGAALRSSTLRNSGLVLGGLLALAALIAGKETGGWYVLAVGLLFAAEMAYRKNGWFEAGLPVFFNIGAYLILDDLRLDRLSHQFLLFSLVWLVPDLVARLAFKHPRPLKWVVRGAGAFLAALAYLTLFFEDSAATAALGFGIYALLFLTASLVYRQPNLFYAFTLTLPLFVTFAFRSFNFAKWIHPVIFLSIGYYAAGFLLRAFKRAAGWDAALLFSGLGTAIVVSTAAPILGGLDAALPVAFAATLWAVEAFRRKNAWLGFPANGLYLLAYFIILAELNVKQPQFFSMGAALLGVIQHYLLTRAESKTGAFIMGALSQLTLLGTTYIQMVGNGSEGLIYFAVLFLQSLAALTYGVVIRSRSLTFTPIFFSVIGVLSALYIVAYDLLDAFTTILMVGCAGILLIGLGILAVILRERITKFSEKLSDWKA